jgi:acyl-CoA synthetase (AMP-forming)/AMP-acid ligase II
VLLHQLVLDRVQSPQGDRRALTDGANSLTYAELGLRIQQFAAGLIEAGLQRGERVAIYCEKRAEFVIAAFGAAAAGGVFVPVNPLLKGAQVGYILRDCDVRVLVTTRSDWRCSKRR